MTATLPPPVRTRLGWVDTLRGLAIALMVLDHVLVQTAQDHALRHSATRLSLPLFCGAAAIVARGTITSRRLLILGLAVVAETILNQPLSLGTPGPVALIALCAIAHTHPTVRSHSATLGLLGLIQALYVPISWSGYQPGLIFAWWALAGAAMPQLQPVAERCPARRALASIGRHPIEWYVAHLMVLTVWVGW